MIHYTAEEGKVYDKLVFPNGDKYAQYFPLEGDVGTSYYYRAKRVDFSENEDEPDKISLTYIKFLLDGGRIKSSSVNADLPKYEAFEGVQTKANNSLQKPEIAPTKTKLVGVGTNGQENIEIGDNLTLANGKLSASGGGGGGVNGLESDAEGNLTATKNLGVDGKLTLKSLVSASNPDGDITKELGGGGGGESTAKLYKHAVSASSNAYGNVRIIFYNYNDVVVNSEKKLKTAIQSIGRLIATGYIKNGSSVYNVHGVYFQPSDVKVYAIGYKADANSGKVSTTELRLDDSFSFSDDVRAVS